ncbi:glycoside hydrolase superfamily [Chytridium lagenaria]|nr:glycoside hydrolase superfamily [Chytridium lagenaria]
MDFWLNLFLLFTIVNAVKREDFKRCDQSGFCVRQRAFAKLVDLKNPVSSYELVPTTVQIDKKAGTLSAHIQESSTSTVFELNLQLLETDGVRVRMSEQDSSARKRFELTDDLALVPEGIKPIAASAAVSTEKEIKLNFRDLQIIIQNKPFKLDVVKGGKAVITLNEDGYLHYEHQRKKEESPEELNEDSSTLSDAEKEIFNLKKDLSRSLWEESFSGKQDNKPYGPTSIGFDISFGSIKHLYGLPEHASGYALKSTRGTAAIYSEPYRLYNFDVFEYELDNPMALYGSIPYIMDVEVAGADKTKSSSHWMAESGVLDVILFVADSPRAACRWNYLDEQDVAEVDANFDKYDIPYDVLWLDIEHTDGKKYFTWDKLKFPTPKDMQQKIAAKGRKDKDLFVKSSSGDVFEGWCWPARQYWAELFKYENYDGSTEALYTWNDMNEPSVFNGPEITMPKDNLHFALQHRATAEGHLLRSNNKDRPFVLSRAFFIGTQRYGAIWTGDNFAKWDHLEASVPMLLTIACFFGNPEPDLLVRWYQTGAFQPFFRAHAHIDTKRTRALVFGEPYTSRIRNAAHEFGVPFPRDIKTFALDNSFMLGSALLIHPIVAKDIASVDVYLPPSAPRLPVVMLRSLTSPDTIPVFLKGGSIVPRRDRIRRAATLALKDPFTLVIALDNQGKASGSLYLDDGKSFEYVSGSYIFTDFTYADNKLTAKGVRKAILDDGKAIKEADLVRIGSSVERIIIAGLKKKPVKASVKDTSVEFDSVTEANGKYNVVIKKPGVEVGRDWVVTVQ